MIDFPASPTDGQVFNAPNGVAYQYSATYSSWLSQNAAPTGGPFLPLVGGTLTGPLTGTTATFAGNVGVKNTITVTGLAGVNSGIVQHDDTHIYVMPTNAGGGTVLGAANANAIIVTTAAVRPVAATTWDLGGSAFRWKDYYGTTANFTANVAGPATVLSVANSNTGSTSQNIFQQSVGTRFVNRTIEYTGQYLIENANGLPTRYSDFDTHNYRTTAGAGYAVLNSAGLTLTGGVAAVGAAFTGSTSLSQTTINGTSATGGHLLFNDTNTGGAVWQAGPGSGSGSPDLWTIYNQGTSLSVLAINKNGTASIGASPPPASNDTGIATTAWVRAASGIWRLASETVLASNASTMAVTIPVGAKQFQIDFECALVGGSNDTFIINCMQGATPYTTGDHNLQVVSGSGSSASAALNTGLTGFTLSSGVQWQGRIIGSLTANPRTTFFATAILSTLQSGARVAQTYELDCGCLRSTVTGFQLRATITNLLAGSVARVSVLT